MLICEIKQMLASKVELYVTTMNASCDTMTCSYRYYSYYFAFIHN